MRQTEPVAGLVAQFRLGDSRSDEAAAASAASVDDLQRLTDSVVSLEHSVGAIAARRYSQPYDIEGLSPAAAAEQVADAERRRLGLGGGPLPHLREVLENDVGLLVFAVPLASESQGSTAMPSPPVAASR